MMTKTPLFLIVAVAGTCPGLVQAVDLTWANITQIHRQVNVLPPGASARGAKVGERIQGQTAVSTGRGSRAELQFNDRTLLRLGSNTTFSIASSQRTLDLEQGSVLIQTVPGGNGGVNIRAGGVTAAITGSMGLFSVAPPADRKLRDQQRVVKFISIHGTMSLEIGGVVYDLEPFEMIFFNVDLEGNLIGAPSIVAIDGQQLTRTSQLINGFKNNDAIDDPEILAELDHQQGEIGNNDWTAVTTNTEDKVPGLPQQNTINLGSIIRPKLPPTPPEPPQMIKRGGGDGVEVNVSSLGAQ